MIVYLDYYFNANYYNRTIILPILRVEADLYRGPGSRRSEKNHFSKLKFQLDIPRSSKAYYTLSHSRTSQYFRGTIYETVLLKGLRLGVNIVCLCNLAAQADSANRHFDISFRAPEDDSFVRDRFGERYWFESLEGSFT